MVKKCECFKEMTSCQVKKRANQSRVGMAMSTWVLGSDSID